jgi:Raf kinase inhibitor-like YbhB/YbcL family protein
MPRLFRLAHLAHFARLPDLTRVAQMLLAPALGSTLLAHAACSSSPSSPSSAHGATSGSPGTSGTTSTSGSSGAGTSAGSGTAAETGATAGAGAGTATGASAGVSAAAGAESGTSAGSGGGAASGESGSSGPTSEPPEAGEGNTAFELTSSGFVGIPLDAGVGDGGSTIPAVDTCADPDGGGLGVSPDLEWTAGPSATMSYTLVLTDTTNKLNHWAVWNMPPSVLSLPMGLPTGAMLASLSGAFQQNFQGKPEYIGPCPAGALHIYEFQIFAIPNATLTGVKSGASTAAVYAEAVKEAIATATLLGRSTAKD